MQRRLVWQSTLYSGKKGGRMEIKDLVGVAVEHKIYGHGIVENVYDKYIEVMFIQRNKNCKFSYPSCFDGYLNLLTDEKKAIVEADLAVWRNESSIVQKEKLRQQYMKTQLSITARRVAAEEKKLREAQRIMSRNLYKQNKNEGKK